jgi:hypothetical protein
MNELMSQVAILVNDGLMSLEGHTIRLTRPGKLLADGIISKLFV